MSLLLLSILLLGDVAEASLNIKFRSQDAKDASNLKDLTFKSRFMLPYGPDLYGRTPPQSSTDHPYAGYGYAMGAGEEIAYDHVNHYLYTASEQGYVVIVDYADPTKPALTDFSFDLTKYDSSLESASICSEQGYFFILLGDLSRLDVYETVKRTDPKPPSRVSSIELGEGTVPTIVLPNKDCSVIAIGKENNGKGHSEGGIAFVENFTNQDQVSVREVSFDKWDDQYILKKGLHMPLTKNSLIYWNNTSPIADEVNYDDLIQNYKSSIFLFPKKLAWSKEDEGELLVNLQENNGLIRIDVKTATALSVASYGIKDHSIVPVDINSEDKTCNLKQYKDLFAMRNPDEIASLTYNDKQYVITANEGDSYERGAFEDLQKAKNLFKGGQFALPNVIVPKRIMDPSMPSAGSAAVFNSECVGNDCVGGTRLVTGSNAIDYETDPNNPIFYRMLMAGGRGWSIYEVPEDPDNLLKLVFDSGDAIEKTGFEAFPWAHNALWDEELAPAANMPNNTFWQISDEEFRQVLIAANDPNEDGCLDQGDGTPGACPMQDMVDARSSKDGASLEMIAVGEACGRLVAVAATEKNSIAYVFDITELQSPIVKKVFHLSPASQFKSPAVAYNDGTIGEIDPENTLLLPAKNSPTGRTAIMFVGAMSGTVSFWEFECEEYGEILVENEEAGSASSSVRQLTWVGALLTLGLSSMVGRA